MYACMYACMHACMHVCRPRPLSVRRYAYRSARKPLGAAGELDADVAGGAAGAGVADDAAAAGGAPGNLAGNVCEKTPLVLLWMSV